MSLQLKVSFLSTKWTEILYDDFLVQKGPNFLSAPHLLGLIKWMRKNSLWSLLIKLKCRQSSSQLGRAQSRLVSCLYLTKLTITYTMANPLNPLRAELSGKIALLLMIFTNIQNEQPQLKYLIKFKLIFICLHQVFI